MLVVIIMLVFGVDFLVVIPVGRLAFLVSDNRYTMNTGNTTLPINHLLRVLPIQIKICEIIVKILIVLIEVVHMRIELILWIKSIKALEIGIVKRVLKTLFKRADYIKVILIWSIEVVRMDVTGRRRWLVGAMLTCLTIHNHFRVALLGWQLKVHILLLLELLLLLVPSIASMSICSAGPHSEAIPDSIHRCKPQLISQLVSSIDIRKRSITLIIECFQLLILPEYFILGAVFA